MSDNYYSYKNLRLKSKEAVAGGQAYQGTYALAHEVQNLLGNNLKYFTAFNDGYHKSDAYFRKKGNKNQSVHSLGLATDIVLSNPRLSKVATQQIIDSLTERGLVQGRDFKLINEYLKPSKGSSGGHLDLRFTSQDAANKYLASLNGTISSAASSNAAIPSNFSNFFQETPKNIPIAFNSPVSVAQTEVLQPIFRQPENYFESNTTPKTQGEIIHQHNDKIAPNMQQSLSITPLVFDDSDSNDYQKEIAAAFGEYPDMSSAIPDYVMSLAKSVYDAV